MPDAQDDDPLVLQDVNDSVWRNGDFPVAEVGEFRDGFSGLRVICSASLCECRSPSAVARAPVSMASMKAARSTSFSYSSRSTGGSNFVDTF